MAESETRVTSGRPFRSVGFDDVRALAGDREKACGAHYVEHHFFLGTIRTSAARPGPNARPARRGTRLDHLSSYSAAISYPRAPWPSPSRLACGGSPAKPRSACAICARPLAPVITTSTMVKEEWKWPRALSCSTRTPAAARPSA